MSAAVGDPVRVIGPIEPLRPEFFGSILDGVSRDQGVAAGTRGTNKAAIGSCAFPQAVRFIRIAYARSERQDSDGRGGRRCHPAVVEQIGFAGADEASVAAAV